jgi:hypothetical protein
MGSIIYDYLQNSVFFSEHELDSAFASLSDNELTKELDRYREFILTSEGALQDEATELNGAFKVFTAMHEIDLHLLRQCAWYVHHFIVDDPLFRLTAPKSNAQAPLEAMLGLRPSPSIDREQVVDVLVKLKALVPMITANYVKLLPVSRLFEPPRQLPITYSSTGFADALPADLMAWFCERATVLPVRTHERGLIVPSTEHALEPTRMIAIEFGRDKADYPFIYQLLEQEIVDVDEATHIARFVMTLPNEPPDKERFDAWVLQSVHQSARAIYMRLLHENALAANLQAEYLTQSSFAAQVMSRGSSPDISIARHTANTLMTLNLAFAEDTDPETLMRVRQDDGEAFENFRVALEKHFREIQLEPDPSKASMKAQHAVHELEAVQLSAVAQQIRDLQRRATIEGAIGAAGLTASFLTGGLSLIATAVAAARGLQSWNEYRTQVRHHPAFFLWKILRSDARKARGLAE